MDRIDESRLKSAAPRGARKLRLPRTRATKAALALAVALALGGGAYLGWNAWNDTSASQRQYTFAVVQRGDLEDAVTATGILQPRDYVDVGTQVSGQLKKLHVEIGSVVKAGQLLAEIDPTVYQSRVDADRAQLRTQEAQLADKEAQLALAQQQHRRQVNLMRENATTQDALDTAGAGLRSAEAQIGVLKAQMEQTRSSLRGNDANLNYTKIYAPMAGTVVAQSAKQGQTLNANQSAPIVVRVADLSVMTVQSQVSEADVPKLKVGQDVYFRTLGSQTKRWTGKLRQINPTPEVVNNVVLYNALFDVENPDRALMTQMTAQVFFVIAQAKDAVLVPVSALRPVGARQRVAGTGGVAADAKAGVQPPSAAAEGAAANPQAAQRERAASGEYKSAEAKGGAQKGGTGRTRATESIDPRSRFANGRASVRVLKGDGTLEEREVQVGVMSRVSAQVTSGLEPGEQVVAGTATPPAQAKANANTNAPRMPPRI
jgi:membrane fusion protein, macrolide-specific efflux system